MLLDDTLRALIAGRLGGFERQALSAPGSKRAAVALALVEEGFGAALPGLRTPAAWSQDAAVLLTRRPSHMRNHLGNGRRRAAASTAPSRRKRPRCANCTKKSALSSTRARSSAASTIS